MPNLSKSLLLALLATLAGCAKSPPVDRRLSAAQLAWQPYRVGQVLRFGRAGSAKVRTYEITAVDDELSEVHRGGNAPVYLGPGQTYRVEDLQVLLRRTDTLRYLPTGASTPARPDSAAVGATPLLGLHTSEDGYVQAPVGWDVGFGNSLPLDYLYNHLYLADTTQHLLPRVLLGGVAYDSVFRLSNSYQASVPRLRPARLVYYAKGYGVVGFVEGATPWYRLP